MAQFIVEEVSRFAGYIHFDQLLNIDLPHYLGAPTYQVRAFVPDHLGKPVEIAAEVSGRASAMAKLNASEPDALDNISGRVAEIDHVGVEVVPLARSLALISPRFDPPQALIDAALHVEYVRASGVPVNPTVTYTFGGSAGRLLDVVQKNELFDNDIIADRGFLLSDVTMTSETLGALSTLVEIGISHLPDGLGANWDRSLGIKQEQLHDGEGIDFGLSLSGDEASSFRVADNGTYINGVRVSDLGQSQQDQSAELQQVAQDILGERDFGSERAAAAAPQASPDIPDVSTFAPTGGAAQIVVAGSNESANVAAVHDLADASGSRIIRGDYYERNVIAQINILAESEGDLPSLDRLIISAQSGDDERLTNEASFVREPGLLYGNIETGYPGAADWHVDYIYGDLIDVTSLIQRNFLDDDDVSLSSEVQSHSVYRLGENDQLNLLNLIELGKAYDLIIVDGSFYKYNAIFQFNVMLDSNAIQQSNTTASVDGADNRLSNDAAIIGVGGTSHVGLSSNAEALADAIANQSTQLDHAWTIGLPGNGNDTIEVLYISGDYFAYNILLQTNIIADVDLIEQAAGDAEIEQSTNATGNLATNSALILDLETQSTYQFLGGSAYEESLLVQANLIVNEDADHASTPSATDPDDSLIGILAAFGEQNDLLQSGADGERIENFDSSAADVVGSLLH